MQTQCARAKSNEKQHNPSTNICVLLCLMMMTLIRTEYCLLAGQEEKEEEGVYNTK